MVQAHGQYTLSCARLSCIEAILHWSCEVTIQTLYISYPPGNPNEQSYPNQQCRNVVKENAAYFQVSEAIGDEGWQWRWQLRQRQGKQRR